MPLLEIVQNNQVLQQLSRIHHPSLRVLSREKIMVMKLGRDKRVNMRNTTIKMMSTPRRMLSKNNKMMVPTLRRRKPSEESRVRKSLSSSTKPMSSEIGMRRLDLRRSRGIKRLRKNRKKKQEWLPKSK